MAVPDKLKDRYDIKETLGQGGMGLVYRATDTTVKRDVAVKTLRDAPTRAALQMFQKECEVLAALSHPNIIEIFDIGEFEDDGKHKPFFVMPLLPGATLDTLIRAASHRLTVERVVDIVSQACRALQAAHERGLIHRDIKPSNIFVMDDDSVKIIDFGVAHMAETGLSIGIKGTLMYMAPEQLQMKPPSPASDIYSLGVVCYETLTRRRPFDGGKESEIVEAILNSVPPPVSDLNPAVSQTLSRVIHKALAKQPWNRYSSAREFAETLQKGLRNDPIEFFDAARIQPRIERATKAFEQGDLQFASEILGELEAEGHIDPAIAPLKRQIAHSEKQKTVSKLLESAKTRFEHEEYPLSLQKIQDILQLDPGNAQALGLKASIENKTTTQKIEEWQRLARQHMENQAWSHAREALRNVLQLKPTETRGAQLLAEVDRLEQEYVRVRKEKDELYNLALEAWNSGEVTTALSKMEKVLDLDQKAPETASQDRTAAYQTFYNKVRSQHESLKNSYASAKKLLEDRNFPAALTIVNEWLAKYPGHALFQALKFDIEEQQRQELSSRIAEIDRQVETEPDFDRRVSILEQAVAQYPGEPHFERQLKPMREKRDLVNSIAAKARYHEERGQFAEALGQWEILGTIYSLYPGLAFEVERVTKKREQQARDEAKARWTGQIESATQSGDYTRALELCDSAEAEFPHDAELGQLRQLAADSAARAAEAQTQLAQAQELCRGGQLDEGVAGMRKALELDPRSAVVRAALLDMLVERARSTIDADWRAAEPFIQQALEIDPGNALAKSLRTTVQDQKRDEAVRNCFTQARQFRASGELDAALAETSKCMQAYPLDPRLAQLRDILSKEINEQRAPAVVAAAATVTGVVLPTAGPPPEDTPTVVALAPVTDAPVTTAPVTEPRPEGAVTPPEAAPPPPPKKPGLHPGLFWGLSGAAAMIVLLIIATAIIPKFRKGAPAPAGIKLEVRTSPPGATVRVNGKIRGTSNFQLEDAPGAYRIDASLEGYEPASITAELKHGAGPIELTLVPLPQTVRVITDLPDGKVSLDGQPARDIQDGQAVFDAVPPGKHTLKLASPSGQAQAEFELAPGAAPQLTAPQDVKTVIGLAVSSFGNRARVYTTVAGAKAQLDGTPAGDVTGEGLQLTNIASGAHEIAVGDGTAQIKRVIETSAAPALTLFFQSDQNIGTFVILTGGVDGADVYVDGQRHRRSTSGGGQLRIQKEPREYRIRVAKPGFEETPELVVRIAKGEERKVVFKMTPLPTTARLSLQGTPGAQVFIDQNAAGTVLADGTFQIANLSPGEHVVELRKDRQRSQAIRRAFAAGQTVTLTNQEVALHGVTGTLKLNVTPAGAAVTATHAGRPAQTIAGASVELEEGAYTITARAPGYGERSETVQIAGGQTASVTIALTREQKKSAALGMDAWDNGAWTRDGEWYVRRGGGLALCRAPGRPGTYGFNIMLASGGGVLRGKSVQWIAGYKDERNYVLYRLEKDDLRRFNIVNGKRVELPRKPHGLKLKDVMASVQVDVAGTTITTRLRSADQWVTTDTVTATSAAFADGRFGVLIEGKDEVRLSGFSFYPKE